MAGLPIGEDRDNTNACTCISTATRYAQLLSISTTPASTYCAIMVGTCTIHSEKANTARNGGSHCRCERRTLDCSPRTPQSFVGLSTGRLPPSPLSQGLHFSAKPQGTCLRCRQNCCATAVSHSRAGLQRQRTKGFKGLNFGRHMALLFNARHEGQPESRILAACAPKRIGW